MRPSLPTNQTNGHAAPFGLNESNFHGSTSAPALAPHLAGFVEEVDNRLHTQVQLGNRANACVIWTTSSGVNRLPALAQAFEMMLELRPNLSWGFEFLSHLILPRATLKQRSF